MRLQHCIRQLVQFFNNSVETHNICNGYFIFKGISFRYGEVRMEASYHKTLFTKGRFSASDANAEIHVLDFT